MRAGTVEVSATEAARGLTLTVQFVDIRKLKARIWLGSKLIKLGAAVIGCKIEFDAPRRV